MNKQNHSKTAKRNKHISIEERFFIEGMLKASCHKLRLNIDL